MVSPRKIPTSALLEHAVALSRKDPESDERWQVVYELLRRGDVETFDAARNWCNSDDVAARELAADLLGQLGAIKQEKGRQFFPFTDRAIPMLEKLMDDPEPRVIASAATSVAKNFVYGPIITRPSLATHPSAAVRLAVAQSLSSDANSKAAIELLIKLSDDEDDDVRDWATLGLGVQSRVDAPEIREALFRRLDDRHFETRSEALVGLARRKDARVIPHISKALNGESVGELAIEAAGHIASQELVEALAQLRSWWDLDRDLLEAALRRCKGESRGDNDDWRWVAEDEMVVPGWTLDKLEG